MRLYILCGAYALIAALILLFLRKKKQLCAARLIWVGLFLAAVLAAYLLKLGVEIGASARTLPFYKLFHYSEYGDLGTFSDLLDYALPFLPVGLFFLYAFPSMGVGRAALAGLLCALGFHLPAVFGGTRPFVLDEYWFAALGSACGAGIGALLLALLRSSPLLERMELQPPRTGVFRAGISVCGLVYLGIALLLIVDFGAHKSSLTLFESTVDMPAVVTSSITFSDDDPTRVPIYTVDSEALDARVQQIAASLGVSGQLQEASGAFAIVGDAGQTIFMEPSGAWSFESRTAMPEGALTLEEAEAAARAFFQEHDDIHITLGPLTDSMKLNYNSNVQFDPAGALTQEEHDALVALAEDAAGYRLYFSTTMDGYRLRNGNELIVTVGPGGEINKIQSMGGSLQQSATTTILKPAQALSKVLAGEIRSYTLFAPAASVNYTQYSLVYFADTVSGEWLPAWSFAGTATTDSGEQIAFEAYVPAAK